MSESTFLKGYPAGSNITILNTIYLKGYKDPETGKYTEDVLYIIFKDLNTNQVKMQMLKSPMYRYYIANEGVDISYNRMYIPIDMVRPVECKYRDLRHSIAQETKNEDFYFECLKGGNYKNTERLFELPNVFMADRHIEDWYRFEFARLYKNDLFSITRAYLDIEADASELPKGTFPEPGQCPVNAISIVNEVNDTIYSLLLEDPKNPQMQEFKSQPGLTAELKAFVEDSVGGWKRAHRFGLDKFKYKIIFFKREIDLIKAAFDIINITKPNFLLAYNMAFDIPYLIARIIKLHYDPCKIICHPDFQQPFCSYYVDNRTEVFAERTDFATITSYTVYLDQLIQFSSRRKGQHAFGSMKLDEIGHKVAGVRKTDYSHITRDITELPKLNYKIFAFYNVMDTVVQYCIEHTVNDIDFVFGKAIMSNTRYSKVHRQTVYLVNKGASNFYHDHYILGDNVNKRNEKNPYDGAFVQEPYLVSSAPKVIVDGRPINLLRNAIDEDYTSLYPSDAEQNNMSPETMHGKILFEQAADPNENRFNNAKFNRSTWFAEDLLSQNPLDFCKRYLGMPSYEEMFDYIIRFFHEIKNPTGSLRIVNPLLDKFIMYHTVVPGEQKKRLMYHIIDDIEKIDKRRLIIPVRRMPKDVSKTNDE